jgi:molybdate transport system regulatory protein
MTPHAKLFILSGGHEGVFGEGKWRLLAAVKTQGSISKAAMSLGRSYRKAWGDIKLTEEALGRPLIVKRRGGADGGRSVLTGFGEELLEAWAKYRNQVNRSLGVAYRRHLDVLIGRMER